VQFATAFVTVSVIALFAQGTGPMIVMMSLCTVLATVFALLQMVLRQRKAAQAATQAAPAE
jgi:hypothetical protein